MTGKMGAEGYGTCSCGRAATVTVREDISDNGRIWLGQDWYRDHRVCDTCAKRLIRERGMGFVGAAGSMADASWRLSPKRGS
jgi:hypothetical protein